MNYYKEQQLLYDIILQESVFSSVWHVVSRKPNKIIKKTLLIISNVTKKAGNALLAALKPYVQGVIWSTGAGTVGYGVYKYSKYKTKQKSKKITEHFNELKNETTRTLKEIQETLKDERKLKSTLFKIRHVLTRLIINAKIIIENVIPPQFKIVSHEFMKYATNLKLLILYSASFSLIVSSIMIFIGYIKSLKQIKNKTQAKKLAQRINTENKKIRSKLKRKK